MTFKIQVKVTVQGHIVGITSFLLISLSFHVDQPSRSWDRAISKTHLENPRWRSWVRSKFKSQCESNILLTHIPLVPCQSALPFLRYSIFKIWPWKSKVKVIAEGHKVGITPYRLILFIPRWSVLLFLGYSCLKIWPWKSNVKVIAEDHKVGITPYRHISLSLHVDRPSHSWVTTFSKFDLENQGSRSWVRSQFKVTMWI